MESIKVGTWELGYENVELFIKEGRDGSFQFTPNPKEMPRIILGGNYVEWQNIYTILIHETMEFALTRGACRYSESQDLSNDTAAFVFMFNHSQFADACAKAAKFIVACHNDLKKAWIKHKIFYKIGKPEMVEVKTPKSFEPGNYVTIPLETVIINTS